MAATTTTSSSNDDAVLQILSRCGDANMELQQHLTETFHASAMPIQFAVNATLKKREDWDKLQGHEALHYLEDALFRFCPGWWRKAHLLQHAPFLKERRMNELIEEADVSLFDRVELRQHGMPKSFEELRSHLEDHLSAAQKVKWKAEVLREKLQEKAGNIRSQTEKFQQLSWVQHAKAAAGLNNHHQSSGQRPSSSKTSPLPSPRLSSTAAPVSVAEFKANDAIVEEEKEKEEKATAIAADIAESNEKVAEGKEEEDEKENDEHSMNKEDDDEEKNESAEAKKAVEEVKVEDGNKTVVESINNNNVEIKEIIAKDPQPKATTTTTTSSSSSSSSPSEPLSLKNSPVLAPVPAKTPSSIEFSSTQPAIGPTITPIAVPLSAESSPSSSSTMTSPAAASRQSKTLSRRLSERSCFVKVSVTDLVLQPTVTPAGYGATYYVCLQMHEQVFRTHDLPGPNCVYHNEDFIFERLLGQPCVINIKIKAREEIPGAKIKQKEIGSASIDLNIMSKTDKKILELQVIRRRLLNADENFGFVRISLQNLGADTESSEELCHPSTFAGASIFHCIDPHIDCEKRKEVATLTSTILETRLSKSDGLKQVYDISGHRKCVYVTAALENYKVRTAAAQTRVLTAKWAESFVFRVTETTAALSMWVVEQGDAFDEVLGWASIPIATLMDMIPPEQAWQQMKTPKKTFSVNVNTWIQLLNPNCDTEAQALSLSTAKQVGSLHIDLNLQYQPLDLLQGYISPQYIHPKDGASKFSISLFKANSRRLFDWLEFIGKVVDGVQYIRRWKDKSLSSLVFLVYMILCIFFWNQLDLVVLPLLVLIIVYLSYYRGVNERLGQEKLDEQANAADDDEEDKATELLNQLRSIKETAVKLQEKIGSIASFFDRGSNLLNWSDNRISGIAVFGLLLLSIVMSIALRVLGGQIIAVLFGVAFMPPKPRFFQDDYEARKDALDYFVARSPDLVDICKRKRAVALMHHTTLKINA